MPGSLAMRESLTLRRIRRCSENLAALGKARWEV